MLPQPMRSKDKFRVPNRKPSSSGGGVDEEAYPIEHNKHILSICVSSLRKGHANPVEHPSSTTIMQLWCGAGMTARFGGQIGKLVRSARVHEMTSSQLYMHRHLGANAEPWRRYAALSSPTRPTEEHATPNLAWLR